MFSKESTYENPQTADIFRLKNIINYTGPILSANLLDGCPVESKVTKLERSIAPVQLWRIRLYNQCFLFCTEDAEFMTPDGSYVQLKDLNPFDKVVCLDMNNNEIAEIKEMMCDYAYCINTEIGNCYLNNILVKA